MKMTKPKSESIFPPPLKPWELIGVLVGYKPLFVVVRTLGVNQGFSRV
jgi:hypothetical protein